MSLLLASVLNQVKGPNQVIIKQVKRKNQVVKTLPERTFCFSGALIPVIFEVAGPEKFVFRIY